jgi:hypothetical protein
LVETVSEARSSHAASIVAARAVVSVTLISVRWGRAELHRPARHAKRIRKP